MTPVLHGGTDALGAAPWDFSSNANAVGPCPIALQAVQQARPERYPDPQYTQLRSALADWHGVEAGRILLATSASECIQRITAWSWREGLRRVWAPRHAYGDYRHAAQAWGLEEVQDPRDAQLAWLCDPSSPLGVSEAPELVGTLRAHAGTLVLDAAYEPLRLCGQPALEGAELGHVWRLMSPNKALGLTGVRAAYAIAPAGAEPAVRSLEALAASWPIGVHGEAMLLAWTQAQTQRWLADSRATLAHWLGQLRQLLARHGWTCQPSQANYLCASPPYRLDVQGLRMRGVKLRDASSFGLPGWWRLSAQSLQAQDALDAALPTLNKEHA